MRNLPPLNLRTKTNDAPHLIILGAGASFAAFPEGDRHGRKLPLMSNLINVVGLEAILASYGVAECLDNFESLYCNLVENGKQNELLQVLEGAVYDYFSKMELPPEVNIYDLLILSLREKDMIATFNWDPFLAQAYKRNRHLQHLPQIAFLHGNVEIGSCEKDKTIGFLTQNCSICSKPFTASKLLFPVAQKNYTDDPFINSEWIRFRETLARAYIITIFGYSAPTTDEAAKEAMLTQWGNNPIQEFAEIEIVDVRSRADLEDTWSEFFIRQHYVIWDTVLNTCAFRNVRRSCEAFAMATIQNDPWRENPFPETRNLSQIYEWLQPLIREEELGSFSGKANLSNLS